MVTDQTSAALAGRPLRRAGFGSRAAPGGYYALDLLPDSPGLPVYSSRGYEGVDRYTFRGQFLVDVQDMIGDDLFQRAWDRMNAAELATYGKALLAGGRRFARRHDLEALEHQRERAADWDENSPESRAHILFSAGAWCAWWAARGHGLESYW